MAQRSRRPIRFPCGCGPNCPRKSPAIVQSRRANLPTLVGQTKSLLFCDDRTLVIDCATAIGDVALSVGITLLPLSHATLGVIRPKSFLSRVVRRATRLIRLRPTLAATYRDAAFFRLCLAPVRGTFALSVADVLRILTRGIMIQPRLFVGAFHLQRGLGRGLSWRYRRPRCREIGIPRGGR
jgi:hypothetical protein